LSTVSKRRGSFPAIFMATALLAICGLPAIGQVDCVEPATLKVSQIRGQVFDPSGVPIPGASVSLGHGNSALSNIKTNSDGSFAFTAADATYDIRVTEQGFEPLHFRLQLHREPQQLIGKRTLWVILGLPGSSCSWATTRHKEFKHLISDFRKKDQS
jgi:Carboxypeptidase regulatory-like domain